MEFPELPADEAPDTPVSFHFEDVSFELPDEAGLTDWLVSVAAAESKPFDELHFIFCSDEYLRQINVEYLDHDYYTDVITFPYSEDRIHGDVFISSERVADNARTNGVSFNHELGRVMVHSVLHLAGFGDKSPEEQTVMRAKENLYLSRFPAA
jgi:probable rRNA maturation factor